MKDDLEKLRTRWRRWLGQKTRCDKPTWTILLGSNWMSWVHRVLKKHNMLIGISQSLLFMSREELKSYCLQAINCADMEDLRKLDDLYVTEKMNL